MDLGPAVPQPRPLLSLERIHKTFGGVVAIEDLTLDVYPGEVMALVGDNVEPVEPRLRATAGMAQARFQPLAAGAGGDEGLGETGAFGQGDVRDHHLHGVFADEPYIKIEMLPNGYTRVHDLRCKK